MLSISRKSADFRERIQQKFVDRISKLPDEKKSDILRLKEIEDEREVIMKAFEEEMKALEIKYDQAFGEVSHKRQEKIASSPSFYSDFWLRVLSNSRAVKELINEEDKQALKYLKSIQSAKLNDGNVNTFSNVRQSFRLSFEFEPNEFFENTYIEKIYNVSNDLHIQSIVSTKIDWKEGKNLTMKKKQKKLKNKSKITYCSFHIDTGDKKTIEIEEPIPSFFNFFSNLKMPTVDDIKQLDFDTEKDLGSHLDQEYELGIELIEEIIPYATEYFVGVSHESEEYIHYVNEQMMDQSEKKKKSNK